MFWSSKNILNQLKSDLKVANGNNVAFICKHKYENLFTKIFEELELRISNILCISIKYLHTYSKKSCNSQL